MLRHRALACLSALAVSLAVLPAHAQERSARPEPAGLVHVGGDYNDGKPLPLAPGTKRAARRLFARAAPTGATYEIGERRPWLAIDDVRGELYLKTFRLRGVGRRVEIWTAGDHDLTSKRLQFQFGDCRNGTGRTWVTRRQVNYLIRQFDDVIFPKESQQFSKPPRRNGSQAMLPELIDLPADTYRGGGGKVVVLIDNVRDGNFYDFNNSQNSSYIAGFFFSFFNELFDRNVMTIDGFDWVHRTGANPPNNPIPGDFCNSAPARPYAYEQVFAHEYQHLLHYYQDPDEVEWVNEGLSDLAESITGYADPSQPITDQRFQAHIQCFLGYGSVQTPANPNPFDGGPENSLTWWGDQGGGEILCDYGAAWTIMEYLQNRFGAGFVSALFREPLNGLRGLQRLLDAFAPGTSASDVVHDWAAMVSLDGIIDDGATVSGPTDDVPVPGGSAALRARYSAAGLDATINWATPDAYSSAGAPPNGSDYVRLRGASGTFLSAGDINNISFDGATQLPAEPVEWDVDESPPLQENDPALFSGAGPQLDRAMVREVSVPAANPTLSFDTLYDTEEDFDFAFVQISTDGGASYTSLANANTTNSADPTADPRITAQLPGFDGFSGGWVTQSFDLSAYAGQNVLLAFRYMTDPLIDGAGWWVDDVKVGNTTISDGSDLSAWRSPSEVAPIPVSGFSVQLIAYDDAHRAARIASLELDDSFDATLTGQALAAAIGSDAETVATIVTYDDPTEAIRRYAPYELRVNGTLQPGG